MGSCHKKVDYFTGLLFQGCTQDSTVGLTLFHTDEIFSCPTALDMTSWGFTQASPMSGPAPAPHIPSSILHTHCCYPYNLIHVQHWETCLWTMGGSLRHDTSGRGLTVLLMLAKSFPLNSTIEYTAPFTSFSATVCSFPGGKKILSLLYEPTFFFFFFFLFCST